MAKKKSSLRKLSKKYKKLKKSHKSEKTKMRTEKEIKKLNVFAKNVTWITTAVIVLVIVLLVIFLPKGLNNNSVNIEEAKSDKMKVYVFGDLECPFTKRIVDSLENLKKDYGDRVELVFKHLPLVGLHPYAYDAAVAAVCAEMQGKGFDFIKQALKTSESLTRSVLENIAKDLQLNIDDFKSCLDSDEAKKKVDGDLNLASSLGISGTPTIIVQEQVIPGYLPWEQFKSIVDDELARFNGTNIELIPTDVKAYFIYKKDCNECKNDELFDLLSRALNFVKFEKIEYDNQKAKEFIDIYNIDTLPAALFEKSIENTVFWRGNPNLISFLFEDVGDYYKMKLSALRVQFRPWFVDPEKRQKMTEIFGGDKENPQITFFVMSFCPYGNIAENALYEVQKTFGDKVTFIPHYIIFGGSSSDLVRRGYQPSNCLQKPNSDYYYCSMHGLNELKQDGRELCVYNLFGQDVFFDFIYNINKNCTINNVETCWQDVAKNLGIDIEKVNQCFNSEVFEYLDEEVVIGEETGIGASPTVYINGVMYNGERTAEGYKSFLCNLIDNNLSECNAKLSNDQSAPQGSC